MQDPIEIKKDNYSEYAGLDTLAFVMNPGSAPGRCGEVNIITSDGKCYHTNFIDEGIDLTLILPVLNEVEDDPADNPGAVPLDWSFRHAFLGNYLFYKDSVKDQLEKGYLELIPSDALEFDWEMIVRIVHGDWTTRIELMELHLDSLEEDVEMLKEALHRYKADVPSIAILRDYLKSGQREIDRKEVMSKNLPYGKLAILKEGEIEQLLSDIDSLPIEA